MTMLAETVDIVIGVDTHKHTHTAALVTSTGALLEERTVTTDPRGYAEILGLACARGTHRAWAIEGTGSYGAGLTRFLEERGEQVIELDRPWRAKRRDGAKSDSIDAARAARDALSRTKLSAPRSGAQRAGLAVLLATRRSAVKASADAQRQLQAFVVAALEALAAMFRVGAVFRCSAWLLVSGSIRAGIQRRLPRPPCSARLPIASSSSPPRPRLTRERSRRLFAPFVRSFSKSPASAPSWQRQSCAHGRIPAGAGPKPPSPSSPAFPPSKHRPARPLATA